MLPYYIDEYEPKQISLDFESAIENLMKEVDKKIAKRRFERIYNSIESMAYTECEDIHEKKEIFVYGFIHIQTDKVDFYKLIGCESDELSEKDKLFNLCSNKFTNKK